MHLMRKLRVQSTRDGSYVEAAGAHAPFLPRLLFLQHLYGASQASALSEALSAVSPVHDQISSDAASLSFNASMRHPHRHTNVISGRTV